MPYMVNRAHVAVWYMAQEERTCIQYMYHWPTKPHTYIGNMNIMTTISISHKQ